MNSAQPEKLRLHEAARKGQSILAAKLGLEKPGAQQLGMPDSLKDSSRNQNTYARAGLENYPGARGNHVAFEVCWNIKAYKRTGGFVAASATLRPES